MCALHAICMIYGLNLHHNVNEKIYVTHHLKMHPLKAGHISIMEIEIWLQTKNRHKTIMHHHLYKISF